MRLMITLRCEEESCGKSQYHTTKNKRNNSERIKIKKYCSFCRRHTTHVETK